MNFKNTLYTLAITGLLIYGLLSFVIIAQGNNDVSSPITDNPLIEQTFGDLNTSLSDSQQDAEIAYGNFSKTPPTQEFGELKVSAITSITSTGKILTTGLWTILVKLPLIILGVDPIVKKTIEALLLITIAIALWLLWKGVGVST